MLSYNLSKEKSIKELKERKFLAQYIKIIHLNISQSMNEILINQSFFKD
jgi:hypothetical protein